MCRKSARSVIRECEAIAEEMDVTYSRDKRMDMDGESVTYDHVFVRLANGSGLVAWTAKHLGEVVMESWKKGERTKAKFDKNVTKLTFEKRLKELLEEAEK